MREAGTERFRTRGDMIHKAPIFDEKEPAFGRESLRSGDVRTLEL